MILNPTAKLPPSDVLYRSRAGVAMEIAKRRSPKSKRKLEVIYKQLTFIIESV